MDPGFVQLAFLIVVGTIVAVVGVVALQAERRRRRTLLAWAASDGWGYAEIDPHDRPNLYVGFQPFGQGHSRRASNVFTKTIDGVELEVFDYRYVTQAGKHSQTHDYAVAVARMPIDGRGLDIRNETFGHKVMDTLGGEDIDVEHDEFSRRFWVQCGDRRFAYDVLHPPMIDFLLARGSPWTWQWHGRALMLQRTGKISILAIQAAAADLRGFAQALPRHRLHEVPRAR